MDSSDVRFGGSNLIYGLTSVSEHDPARDSIYILCERALLQINIFTGHPPPAPTSGTTGRPLRGSNALLRVELNEERGVTRISEEKLDDLLRVLGKQSKIVINNFQPNTITSYEKLEKAHWWSSAPRPDENDWIARLYFVPDPSQS